MKEQPSYWGILPACVRYAKINPMARILFSEITALQNKNGYCNAGNKYFADQYEVEKAAVSKWFKALEKAGFIRCEYIRDGKQITERRVYLTINPMSGESTGVFPENQHPVSTEETPCFHRGKDNNTSINNTRKNNISLTQSETEKKDFLISQLREDPKINDWPLLLRQPNLEVSKILEMAVEFIEWKSGVGEDNWNTYNDFRKNLYRWFPKKLGYEQSNNNRTSKSKLRTIKQRPLTVEERLAEARRKYS